MLQTIRHQDSGPLVVVAKCLSGFLKTSEKISDADSYVKVNGTFDAQFMAYVCSWQTSHGCTPDGVIGPATWEAIAKAAPTCSTAKNRKSGYTFALQLLLGGNLAADAIYGERTKAAVATFQDAHGLAVDGICGPKTWGAVIVGEDVKPHPTPQPTQGTFAQPVDYKQAAKPWGPKMYSNHNDKSQTMANSGCGPTSMADVVATLKDASVDPWTLAQLAMAWGDRTYNSGTAWSFFPHVAKEYGFSKMVQTKNLDALKACLDAGGYVVCSMGPGYWTKSGHFITAWKYDGTYVYCNDPASSSRKKQKISAFKSESKQYFCFYPDAQNKDRSYSGDGEKSEIKRGDKILDISHHQPTVDYDGITGDTALIILRAGYRGTGGGIKIDTCFEKNASELKKRGVRFGVYFYSIATNATKARDEAAAFYDWAKPYAPLFWAVDVEVEEITAAAIRAWAEAMRGYGVKKLGAYVAHHLYKDYGFDGLRDLFDFVWIPRYGSKAPDYKCDLWQYTSTGSVDGISGNVDLDRITGDGHTLEWFCGGE